MTRLLIVILSVFLLAACNKEKVPEGVIAQKKMVPLLCDFHLAEGYLSSLPMDSSRLLAKNYYASIFKKYDTDSAGFNKSLVFYSKDPGLLNQIYAEVQKRLQQYQKDEQAKIDAKMRKVFVADSLKSASIKDSLDKIKADSVNFQLTKNLLYRKDTDSANRKSETWSLPLEKALVKRILYIPNGNSELSKLLLPIDSIKKSKPADSLKIKGPVKSKRR
uniref:DUF4296 domain-containing protein n=1 Tax=Sphingobacterium sp. (strain 21) TaxID=743722 RepID=F4CAJ7_SPHS2